MKITILKKLLFLFFVVTIIPLAILGFLSLHNAERIGTGMSEDAQRLGELAVSNAKESNTEIVGDSFIRLGTKISEDIIEFLEEREQDVLLAAELTKGKSSAEIKEILQDFSVSNSKEIWYNKGPDLRPDEKKEIIPLYSQAAFIDANGKEIVSVLDGEVLGMLKDVSDPLNTEFKSEEYFAKTIALDEGEVYVSRVNTWYLPETQARASLPEDERDGKKWNILPGRDTMKEGNMRFATPVYDGGVLQGIVVLSLDYRHIQALTKHIDPASEDRVVSTAYESNYILMFDDQGDTIVHPKPNNIKGYLEDGTLMHTNTVETPGGIFNLRDYDKTTKYQEMYAKAISGEHLVTSSTDVSGRNKMTITIPIPYDKGEYAESGIFGGIMLSVNTDRFYATVKETEKVLAQEIDSTNRQMMERIDQMRSRSIMMLIITVIVVTILGTLFTRSITNPIKKLKDVADKITSGDFSAQLPNLKGTDELVELNGAMEMMILPLRNKSKKK